MITRCLDPCCPERILEYIGDDFKCTPYLYINIKRYGVSDPNVKVWIDSDGAHISGVYLMYYDCLHFYTKESGAYPHEVFLSMLTECRPKVFMVQRQFGDRLEPGAFGSFKLIKTHLVALQMSSHGKRDDRVQLVERKDLREIAALMLTDRSRAATYEQDILVAQLEARYDDQFSRSFVLRQDGAAAAVYSTYGETDKVVMLGGLITLPQYRRQGLARAVMEHVYSVVGSETATGISLIDCTNGPSIELHKKTGFSFFSSIYKFVANDRGSSS